jgi:hypothetical protein
MPELLAMPGIFRRKHKSDCREMPELRFEAQNLSALNMRKG